MNIAYYLHDETDSNAFEQKLLWFKQHYNLISADELKEYLYDGKSLKGCCMLSVDDGWKSTYDVIFPIMRKHNVPFTIFISPEVTIGRKIFWTYLYKFCNPEELKSIMVAKRYFRPDVTKYPADLMLKEIPVKDVYEVMEEYFEKHPEISIPRGFLNLDEVMELHKSGIVEIGAHSNIHPILKNENDEVCYNEIHDSIEKLSELLNYKVHTFAYPNGMTNIDFSLREIKIAKEAGIDMAFSVNPGVINAKTDPLAIPRWGSMARLKFGKFGQYLPSRANQAKLRNMIKELSLQT